MESSVQALTSDNNIKQINDMEYPIPMVSSDGEPHGVLTMVAALSGVIAAIIVLAILILVIGCEERERNNEQQSAMSVTSVASTSSISRQNSEKTQEQQNNITIIQISGNHQETITDNEPFTSATCAIPSTSRGYDNFACDTDTDNKEELILKAISLPGIKTIRF